PWVSQVICPPPEQHESPGLIAAVSGQAVHLAGLGLGGFAVSVDPLSWFGGIASASYHPATAPPTATPASAGAAGASLLPSPPPTVASAPPDPPCSPPAPPGAAPPDPAVAASAGVGVGAPPGDFDE